MAEEEKQSTAAQAENVALLFRQLALIEEPQRRTQLEAVQFLIKNLADASGAAQFPPGPMKRAIKCVLWNLIAGRLVDEKVVNAVYEFVRASMQQRAVADFAETAVELFSALLEEISAGSGLLHVVKLTCVLLEHLPAAEQPGWASECMQMQAFALEKLASESSPRLAKAAVTQVKKLWRLQPERLEGYERAWGAATSVYAQSQLVRFVEQTNPAMYEDRVKASAVETFVTHVLNGKKPVSDAALEAAVSTMARLSQQDFEQSLFDPLCKALKKSPEGASRPVTALISSATHVDVSAIAVEHLAPASLRMIKSTKEDMRANAHTLMQHVAQKCGSTPIFHQLVTFFTETLAGKNGILAQWYMRYGVVRVLRLLVASVHRVEQEVVNEMGTGTTTTLCAFLEKEGDDATRNQAFLALGEWLSAISHVPDALKSRILTGITNSKAKHLTLGWLAVLHLAIREMPNRPDHKPELCDAALAEALGKMAADAAKKPAVSQPDAALALSTLAVLSTSEEAAKSAMDKYRLWGLFTASESFVYCRSLLQNLSASAADAGTREIHALVVQSVLSAVAAVAQHCEASVNLFPTAGTDRYEESDIASTVEQSTENEDTYMPHHLAAAAGIANYLLSCEHALLAEVKEHVRAIVGASAAALPALIAALQRIVLHAGAEVDRVNTLALSSAEERAKEQPTEKVGWSSSRYLDVLTLLIRGFSTPALLPQLLFIVAHPVVSSSVNRARSVWRQILAHSSLSASAAELDEAATVAEICAWMNVTTTHPSSQLVVANATAMVLLGETIGRHRRGIIRNVMAGFVDQVQQSGFHALSDQDIEAFLHAADDGEDAQEAANAVHKARQRRLRTGRRQQVYSAEDEEWEMQVRAELEAKAKASTPASGAASKQKSSASAAGSKGKGAAAAGGRPAGKAAGLSESQAVHMQKAIIRDRVTQLQAQVARILGAITLIAHSAPRLSRSLYEVVVPAVYLLLRSKIVGAEARVCAVALTRCVEPALVNATSDIADSLWVASSQIDLPLARRETQESRFQKVVNASAPLLGCVKQVSATADRCALDATSAHLLFPIMRAILSLPMMIPGCEDAFKVVDELYPLPEFDDSADGLESKEEDNYFTLVRPLRKEMIELALRVMASFPKIEPDPEGVLLKLTAIVPLSPAEWGPLLGSFGLLHPEAPVRSACLESISAMLDEGFDLRGNPLLESRLWLAVHDPDEECAKVGAEIWGNRGEQLSTTYLAPLLALMQHDNEHVRLASAKAAIAGIKEHPDSSSDTIHQIIELFLASVPKKHNTDMQSEMERYLSAPIGMENKEPEDAKWPTRVATGRALLCVGEMRALDDQHLPLVQEVVEFVVRHGVVDEHDAVRGEMLIAGGSVVRNYGDVLKAEFIGLCDSVLAQTPGRDESIEQFDWRKEAAVVLLGAAAKHLDPSEERLVGILQSLVRALATPAESVQVAVADNIAALGPAVKVHGTHLLDELLGTALSSQSYAERRGAAYGVAAVVKALGIPVLKQNNVIDRLREAVSTGSIGNKQGALFCFEMLSDRLGLLFEPYVIVILPNILQSFSDSSDHVRDAAQGAARVIMQKLSGAGVKQVLTPILRAVPDPNWRTKREAIRLLGTMAYCAPRQLATCLPQIVPKLCEAFTDPHPKVKEAARSSLQDIGSVVRNPEVSRLAPVLLTALSDPAKGTKPALEALLETEFMHSIDAPSLSLLAPILQRGLRDRGADTKRKAAVITGNMTSMISDAKMLIPYLDDLIPGLKMVLTDPIPDVRARAAKALGSLTAGLGEGQGDGELATLIPWLIDTLKADTSTVERSGGAQGLAEVLVALGIDRVAGVLSELLPLKSHPKFNVREGVIWVLCFLPPALGDAFAQHIPDSLPVVLSGLSDEAESVRDVAMRAGQVLVSSHGRNHPMLLLPTLEKGLFDDDWRIRQSSVQLLGDLLYLISGTKALGMHDGDDDQDDDISHSSSRAATVIRQKIGDDHTDNVLAALYIVRSDTSAVVRQSTLQVWKTIVSNTPRTLREIMPKLIDLIVVSLASNSFDKRTVAGRALGDIVRKLGDHVLPEIVPFLRQGLENGDTHMRQGVCLGLSEIMACATKKQIEAFLDTLVPAVQEALCDVSVEVREQAAVAFQSLQKVVGPRATEEVVPSLLRMLDTAVEDLDLSLAPLELVPPRSMADRALFGLKAVVQLKTRDLMQFLLPKLLRRPLSVSDALALGAMFEVSGNTVHYHLHQVMPVLVEELASVCGEQAPSCAAVQRCAISLGKYIDDAGVQVFAVQVGQQINSDDATSRQYAVWVLEQFLTHTSADFTEQVPIFLKDLLQRLNDPAEPVLHATSAALRALNARLPMEELVSNLQFTRTVLTSMISDAKHRRHGTLEKGFLLPGFNIPKGLDPILPMFFEALMHGTPQLRETAALGLGEIVEATSPAALKPYLVKTTGPLIRVVGDKFPSGVKSAILQTLTLLLEKGGVALRPFVPQLQTTFVKSLSDSTKQVRQRGAKALGMLMTLSTRVDPLITELSTQASTADSASARATILEALSNVLVTAGSKATGPVIEKAAQLGITMLGDSDPEVSAAAASCVGTAIAFLDDDLLRSSVARLVDIGGSEQDVVAIAGRLAALTNALEVNAEKLAPLHGELLQYLHWAFNDKRAGVQIGASRALAAFITSAAKTGNIELVVQLLSEFLSDIKAAAEHDSADVRREGLLVIKQAGKLASAVTRAHMVELMQPLLAAVKDPNMKVKLVGERAMIYVLELHSRNETLNEYIARADGESARFVRDYARRVLMRLNPESDTEEEKDTA